MKFTALRGESGAMIDACTYACTHLATILRMLFEFHHNYKIPTSGEYIFLTKDTQIPTYACEGGVGLDIDRCIIWEILYVLMGIATAFL